MKTHIFFLFVLFFLVGTLISVAQEDIDEKEVPEVIKTKLRNLFPGVENVSWQKAGEEYYANFTYEENQTYCAFNYTGRWIVSKTHVKIENVPRSLQRSLSNDFGEYQIEDILLKEDKDFSEYIVTLKDTKDEQIILAYFDIAGNFVKKTSTDGVDLDLGLNIDNNVDNNTNSKNTENNGQPIHPKELPSTINSYLIVNYPDYFIKEAYFLNNDTYTNTYYVILGEELSAKKIEFWFDFQGTLIKTTDMASANDGNERDPGNKKDQRNRKAKDERAAFPESKVPANAVEFFNKKEQRAEEVRWDTLGPGQEYVVYYYNPSRDWDCRMHFDKKGQWLKTVSLRDPRDLHPLIKRHLDENYSDHDIYSVEYFTMADRSKFYLIKVYKKEWLNEPMVYTELYYSVSGRLEKEILADFIDPDDEYYKEQKQFELETLKYVLDNDNIDLDDDNNMIDGQLISEKELPTNANAYIKKNYYPKYRFLEAMIIDEDGKYMYSVFLKKEGYDERKRVLFDQKGNFIKEEDI